MIADFVAIASRSRRYMAQDALGVAGLFALLIGALYLTAL